MSENVLSRTYYTKGDSGKIVIELISLDIDRCQIKKTETFEKTAVRCLSDEMTLIEAEIYFSKMNNAYLGLGWQIEIVPIICTEEDWKEYMSERLT